MQGPRRLAAQRQLYGGEAVDVVVIDDSPVFLDAICFSLRRKPGFRLVAAARDAEEGLYLIGRHLPAVALIDLYMPRLDGVELTRRIKERHPGVKVLALTVSEEHHDLLRALRAGASGYILKSAAADEILHAARAALRNESWLSPRMTRKVLEAYLQSPGQVVRDTVEDRSELTPRERAVLGYVAEGRTNREIADNLYIAETTVKTHVKSIFEKLDVRNRSEAAAAAWSRGMTKAGDPRPGT